MLDDQSALKEQTRDLFGGISFFRMHHIVVPPAKPVIRGQAEKNPPAGDKNADEFTKRREVAINRLFVENVEAGHQVELSGSKWKVENRSAGDTSQPSSAAKLQGERMDVHADHATVSRQKRRHGGTGPASRIQDAKL